MKGCTEDTRVHKHTSTHTQSAAAMLDTKSTCVCPGKSKCLLGMFHHHHSPMERVLFSRVILVVRLKQWQNLSEVGIFESEITLCKGFNLLKTSLDRLWNKNLMKATSSKS